MSCRFAGVEPKPHVSTSSIPAVFIAAGRPSAISLVLKMAMLVSGFCCRSETIRFGAVLPTVESGMST